MTEKKIIISGHKNIKKTDSSRKPGWAFLDLEIKEIDFPHYNSGTYKVNKVLFYGEKREIERGFNHYKDIENSNKKEEITFDMKDLLSIKKDSPPDNQLKALEANEKNKSLTIDLIEAKNKVKIITIKEEPEPPRPDPEEDIEIKIPFTVKSEKKITEKIGSEEYKGLEVELEKEFELNMGVRTGKERKSNITKIIFFAKNSDTKQYKLPADGKTFELSFKKSELRFYLKDTPTFPTKMYDIYGWEGSDELLKVHNADYTDKITLKKIDTPTPPPNPKLDTIIKNLQTAIASGDKDQLVSTIAEGRKSEEESNSSELSRLLTEAEKKLGSLDQKAQRESILSNFQSKMTLNSVKPDQLSSEAQAAQAELTNKEDLTEDRVEEINTLVINNIGETSLTNLITKIKQALTAATPQQLKKFQQELTKFQASTVSYKKHAYQKNQSEVDQLLEQLAEKEKQKENTSTPFWRQPKVIIPLALISLLVLLIIVIVSSNNSSRKRR